MNIEINDKAPVKAKEKILINASVEKVWLVLTTINEWPSWQSAVTEAKLKNGLTEGSHFVWKAGGLTFKSRIHTSEKFKAFGWTGKTIGASAIHNWRFENDNDRTAIYVEESLQGFFPSLFKKKFQKDLELGMIKSLQELKSASEK